MAKPVITLEPYNGGSLAWYADDRFVCWDSCSAPKAREIAAYEHCCGSPRKEDDLLMVADEIDRRKGRG